MQLGSLRIPDRDAQPLIVKGVSSANLRRGGRYLAQPTLLIATRDLISATTMPKRYVDRLQRVTSPLGGQAMERTPTGSTDIFAGVSRPARSQRSQTVH